MLYNWNNTIFQLIEIKIIHAIAKTTKMKEIKIIQIRNSKNNNKKLYKKKNKIENSR
jgi:hypothetical protein